MLKCMDRVRTVYACAQQENHHKTLSLNIYLIYIACTKCKFNVRIGQENHQITIKKTFIFVKNIHVNDVVMDWSYALTGLLVSIIMFLVFPPANPSNFSHT